MTKEEGQVWAAVFAAWWVREVGENTPVKGRAEFAIKLANEAVDALRKTDAINKASLY